MRYYFYPFNDSTKYDFMDSFAEHLGHKAGVLATPAIGFIYSDKGEYVSSLASAVGSDEIYILGHSATAVKVLGDADGVLIDQTEIVNRLEKVDLPKTVSCKIYLYACYSGQGGKDSLAAKVASSLKTRKFDCKQNVYGFTKKVSMLACHGSLCVDMGSNPKEPRWEAIDLHERYVIVHHMPNQ